MRSRVSKRVSKRGSKRGSKTSKQIGGGAEQEWRHTKRMETKGHTWNDTDNVGSGEETKKFKATNKPWKTCLVVSEKNT